MGTGSSTRYAAKALTKLVPKKQNWEHKSGVIAITPRYAAKALTKPVPKKQNSSFAHRPIAISRSHQAPVLDMLLQISAMEFIRVEGLGFR